MVDRIASVAYELSRCEVDECRIAKIKRRAELIQLVGIDARRRPAARVDSFLEYFDSGDQLGRCERAVSITVDER